jgi:bacteriophage N4 adsorption protein A
MEKTEVRKYARVNQLSNVVREAVFQGRKRYAPPLWGVGILIMMTAVPLAAGAPNTSQPMQVGQDENWFQIQVRQFRAYPRLHRAYQLLDQNKLGEAAEEMKRYLAIDPRDNNARVSYMNVLHEQRNAKELLRQANLLLAQHPTHVTALLYRGLASQMQGGAEMALTSFRRVYQQPAAGKESRIFAAGAAADLGISTARYADALAALTVLSSLQDGYSTHYRRGIALAALGHAEEAEAAYELALGRASSHDEKIQVQSELGYVAQRRGNGEKAARHGEAVLALDPMNLAWLRTLANVYYDRKKYSQAERMARRAFSETQALQDRLYLANILAARQNHHAALEHYAKIAEEAQDQHMAYRANMGLGYSYQATDRQAAAHESFSRAMRIKPDPEATAAATSMDTQKRSASTGALEEGDLKSLIAAYKKDRSADGAASIGYLYAQQGDHKKAALYLEDALKIKNKTEWRLQLAEQYAGLGDKEKAAQAAAACTPTTTLDWRRLSEVHRKIDNLEEAAAALSKGADTVEARMQLSRLYVDLQRSDQALVELQAVVNMTGKQSGLQIQALRLLGHIHSQASRLQQAIEAFQAAIGKGDNDPATRKDLGFLFAKAEKYPEALEQFLHVLEHQPTAQNMMSVARLYAAMKQREPALQYYKMAESHPQGLDREGLTALYAESGFLFAEEGEFKLVRQYWSQSAANHNTSAMQMNLAYAEEMLGMYEEAFARLNGVAPDSMDKDHKLHLFDQYARLHEKTGNAGEAMRYLVRATALEPSAERHSRTALYALKLGEHEIARAYLDEAAVISPQNNDYVERLAYVCKAQEDNACVIRMFVRAKRNDRTRVSWSQDLAYAYSREGENDKAIDSFKMAIDSKMEAKPMASSRSYFHDPQRPEAIAQNNVSDDEQIYMMRKQVREMARRYQFNAYQSYRTNAHQYTSAVTPGFATGGLIPSQGGIEFLYQPPGIGYRDGKTFRLFGRVLWSNEPESLDIDTSTTQGGVGIEYKPWREANVYVGLERLIKFGSESQNNWLARASWGYSDGYDMKPNQHAWNQTIIYADVGYFLQRDNIRSIYAQLRQGRTYNFSNTTMVTPHLTLAGRGQDPDPFDASYLEAGVGVGVKYLFNETRHEAARSGVEFIVQYRKGVTDRVAGGWVLTADLQF